MVKILILSKWNMEFWVKFAMLKNKIKWICIKVSYKVAVTKNKWRETKILIIYYSIMINYLKTHFNTKDWYWLSITSQQVHAGVIC